MKKFFLLSSLFAVIMISPSCKKEDKSEPTPVTPTPTPTPATTVTDVDGNVYHMVTICGKVFLKENLNVGHYRNGDPIPVVNDPVVWKTLTTGACSYQYSLASSYYPIYGKVYNWYAVNDSRGLAPTGYHISTDADWTTITNCLGGDSIAGGKMKDSLYWSNFIPSNNSSGLSIRGGGFMFQSMACPSGSCGVDDNAWYWCSDGDGSGAMYRREFTYGSNYIYRALSTSMVPGYSVRGVKD
jgi:uncharacterized protein (TIGR02145 family)